eukprot:898869-Lingulodinium_polyedra.AAC.1
MTRGSALLRCPPRSGFSVTASTTLRTRGARCGAQQMVWSPSNQSPPPPPAPHLAMPSSGIVCQ